MRSVHVRIVNFRCFEDLEIRPRQHVGLVGPPGGGRSALLDALTLVLDPNSTRTVPSDDRDFHRGRVDAPIVVEVTLADLDTSLEQHFLPHTEPWDTSAGQVLSELEASLSEVSHDRVLRLGYFAEWLPHEERVDHTVYYAKGADLDGPTFEAVRRSDRELLPFVRVGPAGTALSLRERTDFRRLVERSDADDLHDALQRSREHLVNAADVVGGTDQIRDAVRRTADGLQPLLPLAGPAEESIRFVPGGTSLAGLLRSLNPEVDTVDGKMSLSQTGSTSSSLFVFAHSLALIEEGGAVVIADDFGDQLDAGAASHLYAMLTRQSHQSWVATRRPDVAEAFEIGDVLRVHQVEDGSRRASQFPRLKDMDRSARTTLKHLAPQMLRASTGRCAVIVEGPDDANSIDAMSQRMVAEGAAPGLAAARTTVIHPGLMQASGGHGATGRLARVAGLLHLRTVAVLDGDTDDDDVASVLEVASAVVRLPNAFAIERLLVHDLNEEVLMDTFQALIDAFDLPVTVDTDDLDLTGIDVLKKKGKGLHSTFIAALPDGQLPPLGIELVTSLVAAADGKDGLTQLTV